MTPHRFDIELPPGYRRQDALAFHGRDAEGLAERVEGDTIRKGVLLDGVPVQLAIVLDDGAARCTVDCAVDCAVDSAAEPLLPAARAALVNMLGLRIDPTSFEAAVRSDPLFGPLTRRTPGLRVIQSATVFEALTWAVIGQQINLPFAIALRRSFIGQAGRPHPDGLWCYPEAADVARLDIEQLTSRKFSRAKAETLLRLARLVTERGLRLDAAPGELAATAARLLAIKGIGPWTVNYALLRGYGDPDCSLHGDVAVRTAIGRLQGTPTRPDIAEAEAFLAAYRPQRTMAAAYLWASLNQPAG